MKTELCYCLSYNFFQALLFLFPSMYFNSKIQWHENCVFRLFYWFVEKVTLYAHMKMKRSILPGSLFVRLWEQDWATRIYFTPRMNLPLHRLRTSKEGFLEGCAGVGYARTPDGVNARAENICFLCKSQWLWPEVERPLGNLDNGCHGAEFSFFYYARKHTTMDPSERQHPPL